MKDVSELRKNLLGLIRPRERLAVSAWADEYIMLPTSSAEPGHYRTSRVPYFKEVMDVFTDPAISQVVVKSASQTGKSAVLLNVLGYYAHQDPTTMMIIQPTLDDARDFSKSRLAQLIKDSKELTPLFYTKEKTRDADQTILSKFFKGGRIILVGANSPSGLASKPIKILLCDEVDRYPPSASKEGDPISIATARTTTYFDAKLGIFSTPTVKGASRIDLEYELGTQEEWRHRCPGCGSWELLSLENMLPDYEAKQDKSGNRTVLVKAVKWACPSCGEVFDERTIRRTEQKYVVKNPDALANGIRSFFVNGFSSPWLKWTRILREWLTVKGDPLREAVIYNTRFGLSYEMPTELEDTPAETLEEYTAQVPEGVLLLTAGVDCQQDRLEYAVYGWNAGGCFGIKTDVVRGAPTNPATWQKLEECLNEKFRYKSGKAIGIARTFIDSGYATDWVYGYCRGRVDRFAIKGKSIFGGLLLHKTSWLPEGLFLTTLNVDAGKSEVYALIAAGKVHFGSDDVMARHFDEKFFKQLTAERRERKFVGGIVKDVWRLPKHRRNEALDILVYALAAMRSCIDGDEENFWRSLAEEPVEIKKAPARKIISRSLEVY